MGTTPITNNSMPTSANALQAYKTCRQGAIESTGLLLGLNSVKGSKDAAIGVALLGAFDHKDCLEKFPEGAALFKQLPEAERVQFDRPIFLEKYKEGSTTARQMEQEKSRQ